MRIGYPCINRSIDCHSDHTFRLKNYSEGRLIETVRANLSCLLRILQFNVENRLYFFRVTSDLVPFASHPINKFDWQKYFEPEFAMIGDFIRKNDLRISMHPDQFTLINSLDVEIFKRSVGELEYHADVLELMELDKTAKIQIHVGGVYKEKEKSMDRFIKRYRMLSKRIRKRLVVENDEHSYTLEDCLKIHAAVGLPVLFDVYHHRWNNNGEEIQQCMERSGRTWANRDGIPMVDYSQRKKGSPTKAHAETMEARGFRRFLQLTEPHDFDIMLEIKDKEKSARRAAKIAADDRRFIEH
ncbi:MAG: UV DNA damage repair endonuclease UvsE [candidate division WOR-3 bacterium]|nr:MAG: UV DNA damage repair endonuclease UvsE [candidate division WOR-3 bacterium]